VPGRNVALVWSRRRLLRLGGALGGLVGVSAVLPAGAAAAVREPVTVEAWRASWTDPVLVAHRGSGDTHPEHTMVAYQAAVDGGATAMEISVGITSDGVLVCMHDATYDRTTTGTGRLDGQPASVLDDIRVRQPHLGRYWVENAPRVPLLEEVLDRFGGRVVLCLEAKNRAAYAPMMASVVRRGLQRSVMVKVHHTSDVLALAAADGYPRFAYLGSLDEVTDANIALLQASLDPARDVMVIAAGLGPATRPFVSDALVRTAVATGIPVWVFPLHRRWELRHFTDLGVRGAVCAGYVYLAGAVAPVVRDSWALQRAAPGELALTVTTPPTWTADGELVLDLPGRPHFVMPGQFGPVRSAAGRWSLDVDLRWREAPLTSDGLLSVAFAHEDDRYYEHRGGSGTGYHATLRADGRLGLYLHRDLRVAGRQLAEVATPAPVTGRWVHLRIEVTPTTVTVRRTDTGNELRAADDTVRGGYLHLGRASRTGVAGFRALRIG
jgi:glycerophosphoryl diester phosphodiesterase